MKRNYWFIGLMTGMLVSFFPFQLINSADLPHKVLKTEKMPANPNQFKNLRSIDFNNLIYHPIAATGSHVSGRLCCANSEYRKLNAALSNSGLSIEQVEIERDQTIRFLRGDLGKLNDFTKWCKSEIKALPTTSLSKTTIPDVKAALGWLTRFSSVTGLDQADEELLVKDYSMDELGKRHIKFQQVYNDLPVWAEELYLHIDENDHIYMLNGRYRATPSQIKDFVGKLSEQQAMEIAKSWLVSQNKWVDMDPTMKEQFNFPEPSIEKVIWFDLSSQPHLVWFVDIHPSLYDWFYLFIDAETGSLLHQINNRKNSGFVNASGTDLYGVTKQFRALQDGSKYYMLSDVNNCQLGTDNWTGGIAVYDWNYQSYDDQSADVYVVSSSNSNSWSIRSAVSAIDNAKTCYEYYKNTHNRNGIDDQSSTINSIVNVNDENGAAMDNAFWSGVALFFGNGYSDFRPLAGALDVTAHEMTHGVTEHTANLVYQFQSGALNEATSDFFACMVDRQDWLIGEDITLHALALRDMQTPSSTQVLNQLPVNMDQYRDMDYNSDNGGVHVNCGIMNRALYLVANSVGRDKAEKMYYRALKNYLVRQSEFVDARSTLEQSAQDLYSETEVNAVKAAFDVVKIGSGTGYNPSEDDTNPTVGGSEWIAYVRDDLQIGLYNYDQDQDWFLPDVTVMTKTDYYGQIVNYSQLTITADGKYLYFVNENGQIARVDLSQLVSNGQFEIDIFDDIYISSAGDIWNVAVTRDNAMLAFTSIYEDDRNIYFYIDNQIYSLKLDMSSTQEGIEVNSIQYADVLDWSPNCAYRKLGFDAYNEYSLGWTGSTNWWCMGEVDLANEDNIQIYSLLPPQPEGYSVGNIEYSSYDPDIIAYNYIEPDGNWIVNVVNYDESSKNQSLYISNQDIERPTFSPDDKMIAVDRLSDNHLLILDLEQNTYKMINSLSSGARNSEWFVANGNYDTDIAEDSATDPTHFKLGQNYPNPFNSSTIIEYQLPEAQQVEINIINIKGQRVNRLINDHQSAGSHQVIWNGTDDSGRPAAGGVYFYQIKAGRSMATKKLVLLQ